MDPKVNDECAELCEETYGSDDLGHDKVVREEIHKYLGMIMDFIQEGALKIDLKYYTKGMLEEYPYKIKATHKKPWTKNC